MSEKSSLHTPALFQRAIFAAASGVPSLYGGTSGSQIGFSPAPAIAPARAEMLGPGQALRARHASRAGEFSQSVRLSRSRYSGLRANPTQVEAYQSHSPPPSCLISAVYPSF